MSLFRSLSLSSFSSLSSDSSLSDLSSDYHRRHRYTSKSKRSRDKSRDRRRTYSPSTSRSHTLARTDSVDGSKASKGQALVPYAPPTPGRGAVMRYHPTYSYGSELTSSGSSETQSSVTTSSAPTSTSGSYDRSVRRYHAYSRRSSETLHSDYDRLEYENEKSNRPPYQIHGRTDVLPALQLEPYSAFLAAYRLAHLSSRDEPIFSLKEPGPPTQLLPALTPAEKRARRLAMLLDADDADIKDWATEEYVKLGRSGRRLVREGVFEVRGVTETLDVRQADGEYRSEVEDVDVEGDVDLERLKKERERREKREEEEREMMWAREMFGKWMGDGRVEGVFKEAAGVLNELLKEGAREEGEEWVGDDEDEGSERDADETEREDEGLYLDRPKANDVVPVVQTDQSSKVTDKGKGKALPPTDAQPPHPHSPDPLLHPAKSLPDVDESPSPALLTYSVSAILPEEPVPDESTVVPPPSKQPPPAPVDFETSLTEGQYDSYADFYKRDPRRMAKSPPITPAQLPKPLWVRRSPQKRTPRPKSRPISQAISKDVSPTRRPKTPPAVAQPQPQLPLPLSPSAPVSQIQPSPTTILPESERPESPPKIVPPPREASPPPKPTPPRRAPSKTASPARLQDSKPASPKPVRRSSQPHTAAQSPRRESRSKVISPPQAATPTQPTPDQQFESYSDLLALDPRRRALTQSRKEPKDEGSRRNDRPSRNHPSSHARPAPARNPPRRRARSPSTRLSSPTNSLEDIAISSDISPSSGGLTTPNASIAHSRSPSPSRRHGRSTKRAHGRVASGFTTPTHSRSPERRRAAPVPVPAPMRSYKPFRLWGGAASDEDDGESTRRGSGAPPSPSRRRHTHEDPLIPPSTRASDAGDDDVPSALPPIPPLPPVQFWLPGQPERDDTGAPPPPVFLALGARRACIPYTPAFQGLDLRVVKPVSARERLAVRDAAAVLVGLGARVVGDGQGVKGEMWSLSYVGF